MRVTDVAGLPSGLTLVATSQASLLVIDRLQVLQSYDGLDSPLMRIAPLGERSYVAVTQSGCVEVFDKHLEHDVLPGARQSSFARTPHLQRRGRFNEC